MAKIGELIINIKGDTAAIVKDLAETRAGIQEFVASSRAALGGLIEMATLGAGLEGLRAFTEGTIGLAAHMRIAAQEVGLSVEELSDLRYAAEQSGVGMDSLQRGLGILSKNLLAASEQSKQQAAIFDSLGIAVKNVNGVVRPTTEILADLADTFRSLPDGPTKTALAMELFGRAGKELIPLLNEGRAGLDEFRAAAKAAGVEIGTDFAEQAHKVEQAGNTFKEIVRGMGLSLGELALKAAEFAGEGFLFSSLTGGIALSQIKETKVELIDELEWMKKAKEEEVSAALAGAAARAKAIEEAKKHAEQVQHLVEKLREEVSTVGLSKTAMDQYRLAQLGASAATKQLVAGLDAELSQMQQVKRIQDEQNRMRLAQLGTGQDIFAADTERWQKAMQAAKPTAEEIDADIRRIGQDTKVTDEQLRAWGLTLGEIIPPAKEKLFDLDKVMQQFQVHAVDAFAQAIAHGRGFEQVLQQLVQEIIQVVTKLALMKALVSLIPGFGGFAGLTGAGFPGFAAGGTPTPGVPVVVGESGPELFVPQTAGSIVPSGQWSAGGMQNHQYFDFRGADASVIPQIYQAIERMTDVATARALVAAREMQLRTIPGAYY